MLLLPSSFVGWWLVTTHYGANKRCLVILLPLHFFSLLLLLSITLSLLLPQCLLRDCLPTSYPSWILLTTNDLAETPRLANIAQKSRNAHRLPDIGPISHAADLLAVPHSHASFERGFPFILSKPSILLTIPLWQWNFHLQPLD